ncbi:hypothetical protein K2173_023527 [Erythroxylum novogranatense]|uniref:Transmembrane protein 234 homolog n=1 Tax=Erythroxylum novogranatense TaxID=1862640 RepID=A0AAV8TQZ3_9ROSI|nr:hypothetical protein K2173_023527 [Erythroxylum novogranatense]
MAPAMSDDVQKMVVIGLVWGATNALIRRGTLLWDRQSVKSSPPSNSQKLHLKILSAVKNWVSLLFFWQYSVPFLINLSASATFFAILSEAPISLAVPVTNATTFAATAVFGMLLGEKIRVGFALLAVADHVVISYPLHLALFGRVNWLYGGNVHQLAGFLLLTAH